MLMNAIGVGLACMLVKWGNWWGMMGWDRPMMASTITGILLGHPTEGIVIGASLELVYMGTQSMGGVLPQDYAIGGVFGSAFAILIGAKMSVAVALSIPFSMLGTLLYDLFKFIPTAWTTKFQEYLNRHDIKGFKRLWDLQATIFLTMWFLIGFVSILAGTTAIKSLVSAIPPVIQNSLTVAAGMLPALGMALLLVTLWDKKLAPYFFIGFGLVAFFKGTLIEVAFLATAIALIVAVSELNKIQGVKRSSVQQTEEEDFFDDK
ncbi:PTS sugar transporter subunit IIC [Lactobacillus sp. ESL0791]|uniref:PTS mannose/fructose/sorbose/N-acetylgalactosamine transporter subunit IIC n=1 Tax=Lactobacillus sp. ESL0791 TaxID=2983234 RepID=UPI0023F8CCB5|nr:PTS sugar transporter subunit IIC [Lactobacillus sp. ESL0791]MDF7637903.1 PTS sugar transporter subunit IIC [Lactobacillus sp. ESL0791]